MKTPNISNHPCSGKCTEFNEDRCNTCLILAPACNYCGSEQLVMKLPGENHFACSDCVDDLEPVAPDLAEHYARAVVAQGEIS